jgi:hypothetical protein
VAEVFAGFLMGYAYSLLFTAIVAVMIINARSRVPYLAKAIAPNISPVMLAVPVSILGFLGWTMVGMILGLLYRGSLDTLEGGGLGSPNWPFTLGVLLAGGGFLVLVLYAWRRLPWQALLLAAAFVALFGWAMPHLASAG